MLTLAIASGVTFLPIVGRELRVASRRRGTFWVRCSGAAAVIVLGTVVYLSMHDSSQKSIGYALFGNITGAAALYCLFSGVRATADCLSEEKREGTLGLLFLTDLKGYDVVLGKLAGTSLNVIYGMVAVLPVMAIPLLLGGVTIEEFGRMAVVILNTLFFSLTVGLFVSTLTRSSRLAVMATFLLLLCISGVLPASGTLLAHLLKKPQLQQWLLFPSPGFSFFMAFAQPYKTQPNAFWWSIGLIHGLAWSLLVISAIVAPRSWQDKPPGPQHLKWREQWHLWSYGNSQQRRDFRSRLLDANAYYWLSARARLKPAMVWAVLGLLGCAWVWGLAKYGHDWLDVGLYISTGIVLSLLLKTWFASEAGRQLVEDRKQGSLELVLSTPLSIRDILRGQRLALQRQFLGPLIAVLAACILLMFATSHDLKNTTDLKFWLMLWSAGLLMLVADLVALYWVGMWQALITKHPNRTAGASATRILVLPWVAFLLLCLLMSFSRIQIGEPEVFFLSIWFIIGLATDIGFGLWARGKLTSDFRFVAAERRIRQRASLKRLFPGVESSAATQLATAKSEGRV